MKGSSHVCEAVKLRAQSVPRSCPTGAQNFGTSFFRPFGGRKILYIWEKIETDMGSAAHQGFAIPMANGAACHG